MAKILTWEEDCAVAPDGVVYTLAPENINGAHGGRMWRVFVYDHVGEPPTRILLRGYGSKREARAIAEKDAQKNADRKDER